MIVSASDYHSNLTSINHHLSDLSHLSVETNILPNMAKPVDMELRKAFMELHLKMVETSEKIQIIDAQLDMFKRHLQHVDVTQREISTLPPGTKTYESVGRMFLLTDLEEVKTNLKNREAQVIARTTELTNNKQYLEKNLKESEEPIREMVRQRKNQNDPKSN